MPRKIVVTGSAGFIGSHLVDRLLELDYAVVGVDNLSMGSRDNHRHHESNPRFAFHETDVRDLATLQELSRGAATIIHLAAFKIPRYGKSIDTLLINTDGGRNVLEAARGSGSTVVMASTSDVFGKNPHLPFSEESDSVFGPSNVRRWAYAVSKLFDEHLAFAYQESYGVPVVVLRFFGGYGPREHRSWWGGPQSVFIENALHGREIEIHGDGQQTRSFAYVTDLVQGIVAALESDRAVGEVLNIGNAHEISILDLARLVSRLVTGGDDLKIRFVPYSDFGGRYEDVMRRVPDLSKARRMLGFACQITLEEGLRRTIEWHRTRLVTPSPMS